MFSINLKSSIATVAVIAGVLAVAGPASASSTPLQNSMVSGVVQAPGGQGRVGVDARGFIESQYVATVAEAVIGMAPNGGLAHERESSAASSAAQKDGSSNTLMIGLDEDGSPLKADSNKVAVEGVTGKTSSLTAEGNLYAGVARTSVGFFKSLSGMDSETEFMDYTDDSLLD